MMNDLLHVIYEKSPWWNLLWRGGKVIILTHHNFLEHESPSEVVVDLLSRARDLGIRFTNRFDMATTGEPYHNDANYFSYYVKRHTIYFASESDLLQFKLTFM